MAKKKLVLYNSPLFLYKRNKVHPQKNAENFLKRFFPTLDRIDGTHLYRRLGVMLPSHRRHSREWCECDRGVFLGVGPTRECDGPRLLHRSESRWRNSQKGGLVKGHDKPNTWELRHLLSLRWLYKLGVLFAEKEW